MRLKPSMRALAKIFYKEAAILFISLPMHLWFINDTVHSSDYIAVNERMISE
jgi:flagellar biosynthesis protein FliR